jgi:hypothetical protein
VCTLAIGLAIGCGEEEPWDDAAAFAPPVEAAPPAGTWDHEEPTSPEELARQIAEEMRALAAAGYLADEVIVPEAGSFTGTAPPPVAFEIQGGFEADGDAPGWSGGGDDLP